MKPVRLAPEAVTELADAAVWYESRSPGLARSFLQEFETLLQLIESRSASFPRLLDTSPELNIRRALLPRFPYASIFIELPSEIRIIAVAHVKRRPG
jgi:toxin ParE1/3/4